MHLYLIISVPRCETSVAMVSEVLLVTEAKAQQQSDLKQNGGDSSLSLENSSRQNNLVILFWVGGEPKKQVEWKSLR